MSNDKFYIGQTSDLPARLHRHQSGQNKYTKPFRPVKLVYTEKCNSRAEAMKLEKNIKRHKDRQYIQQLIANAASSSNG